MDYIKTWLLGLVIAAAAIFVSTAFDFDITYVTLGMVCYHIAESFIKED